MNIKALKGFPRGHYKTAATFQNSPVQLLEFLSRPGKTIVDYTSVA
jgi:hypothetical protein